MLTITLADKEGLQWAQQTVSEYHYLRKPVDIRSRPISYTILLGNERVGCLIFSRMESTFCRGHYGSVEDVKCGVCPLTRWQILNLSRVWLDPRIQQGHECYIPNAASQVISQALKRVGYDYLIEKPVVWVEEPYEIRECLSYCDTRKHTGALYRASNFQFKRKNEDGIETYVRPLRRLTHAEHACIHERSQHDPRAQRLRRERDYQQLSWLEMEAV